ncbi:hypothetical protein P9112_005701 [Eukaryota sp. TZLM1-RC]
MSLHTARPIPSLNLPKFRSSLHVSQASRITSRYHRPRPSVVVPKTTRISNNSSICSQRFPSLPKTSRPSVSTGRRSSTLSTLDTSDLPLPSNDALKKYRNQLTPLEESEILGYQTVYFTGSLSVKSRPNGSTNNGYDDDRGDYLPVLRDHIAYRYEILGSLGKGSFGQVLRVMDHKMNKVVALKIIRNKRRFHQQGLVEVRVLKYLKDLDSNNSFNLVHIINHFYFRNHLCISFELLSINLYEYMKANSFQPIPIQLVKSFTIQLLQCLQLLYKNSIIHCDLKPENCLFLKSSKSLIKVIDFGSSCFSDERVYTYIQSRFYRAPEVILGLPYSCAIDMWSLGCMLAEFSSGTPLFPGENEHEQMLCIMEIFGLPPQHLISNASRRKLFFDSQFGPRIVANSRGKKRRPSTRDLSSAVRSSNPLFLDFLRQCLAWDPNIRLTPSQALQHPFLNEQNDKPVVIEEGLLPPI